MSHKKVLLVFALSLLTLVFLFASGCTSSSPSTSSTSAPATVVQNTTTTATVTTTATAAATTQPAKVFKWKFQSTENNTISMYRERDAICAEIKKLTNGGLDITQYAGGSIVSDANIPGAVKAGTIEMANVYLNPLYAACPVTQMVGITPGFLFSVADNILFMNAYGAGEILQQESLKAFNAYSWPELTGAVLVCTNKPVKEIADFKGLKIRSYGPLGNMYTKLGASVVNVSGGEVYTALQTGVLDAANWGAYQGGVGIKIYEVTKYFIEPTMGVGCGTVNMVSKAAFDSLPVEYQNILTSKFANRQLTCVKTSNTEEVAARKLMLDKGMQVSHLSADAMAKLREMGLAEMKALSTADAASQKVYELLQTFLAHQDSLAWNK